MVRDGMSHLRNFLGAGEMAQQSKSTFSSYGGPGSLVSTGAHKATKSSSRSSRSNTLFWPPKPPTHVAHLDTNTSTQIKFKKQSLNKWKKLSFKTKQYKNHVTWPFPALSM